MVLPPKGLGWFASQQTTYTMTAFLKNPAFAFAHNSKHNQLVAHLRRRRWVFCLALGSDNILGETIYATL
jgi:hypothetical protein